MINGQYQVDYHTNIITSHSQSDYTGFGGNYTDSPLHTHALKLTIDITYYVTQYIISMS